MKILLSKIIFNIALFEIMIGLFFSPRLMFNFYNKTSPRCTEFLDFFWEGYLPERTRMLQLLELRVRMRTLTHVMEKFDYPLGHPWRRREIRWLRQKLPEIHKIAELTEADRALLLEAEMLSHETSISAKPAANHHSDMK